MRIVATQGPLQALVAGAVASQADRESPDDNVLLIGGLETAGEDALAAATRTCASVGPWSEILQVPAETDPLARIDRASPISELILIRNWQPLNVRLLEAFPHARVTVYGDTFGIIDTDLAGPRFDRVLTVVPQPERAGVFRDRPVEVVPRETVTAAVRAAREALPDLVAYDAELAAWARDGVLGLLGNLTEAGGSTLMGEIAQGHGLVRSIAAPGAPIVLKPHPRAKLGQAAAIARRLRAEGHPVRIVTAEPFGVYPIELFESLARSVAGIQTGQSTAPVSLLYLYGVESVADLPIFLGARTQFPYGWRRGWSIAEHNRRILRLLPGWDERSPLPVPPRVTAGRFERALGGLLGRVFAWNRTAPRTERPVAAQAPEGDVRDERLGLGWAVPRDSRSGLLDGLPGESRERLAATLQRLRERAPGAAVSVSAHVRPSAGAPRWERAITRGAPLSVAENARFSAEELEDRLEAHVDVTERTPESTHRNPFRARRRDAAPLRVHLAGRLRSAP